MIKKGLYCAFGEYIRHPNEIGEEEIQKYQQLCFKQWEWSYGFRMRVVLEIIRYLDSGIRPLTKQDSLSLEKE